MNRVLKLGMALFLAMPMMSFASKTSPDFRPLAAMIEKAKQATAMPTGVAIAVVRDGKVIYEGYFGLADLAAQTPVTRDTAFYIASATKPFFALLALLQEARGKLDTGMSLQQMYPGVGFRGFDAGKVTVRDLLTHASGVDNEPLVWATAFSGIHTPTSLKALVADSTSSTDAAHGTFKYTNVGYNIVSIWMDQHTGTPWQAHLRREIFTPLGMTHTTAYVSEAEKAGWAMARPYSLASSQPREPLYLSKSDDTMQAAGGMFSTAPDLARFLIAELGGSTALPAAVIARSQHVQVPVASTYQNFERNGYAWGWYSGTYKGQVLLHHFGAFAGFHAHLSFMPEKGLGLVVLNNEDVLCAQTTQLIADYVYGALLGEPDVAGKVSRRFDEVVARAARITAAAARQRQSIQARVWRLSQPREAYAGRYSHEQLGDLVVSMAPDGAFLLRWGRLQAIASAGKDPDQIRAELVPGSGQFLQFAMTNGVARSVAIGSMVFHRRSSE